MNSPLGVNAGRGPPANPLPLFIWTVRLAAEAATWPPSPPPVAATATPPRCWAALAAKVERTPASKRLFDGGLPHGGGKEYRSWPYARGADADRRRYHCRAECRTAAGDEDGGRAVKDNEG